MATSVTAALKAIIKFLSLFISKEDLLKFGLILLIAPLLLLALVFAIPFVIFSHIPAVDEDITEFYIQATNAVNSEFEISINFTDVLALDAVLLGQEFEKSSYNQAYNTAKEFVGERIIEVTEEYEDTCTDSSGKTYTCIQTRTVEKIEYYAKSIDEVCSEYLASGRFTQEDVEAVKRYAGTIFEESDGEIGPIGDLPPITDGMFMRPTTGRITSHFGQRWGRFHSGLDIAKPGDVAVVASADGVVSKSYYSPAVYGHVVMIVHNINGKTYETLYAHMRNRAVSEGQTVAKGTYIGKMGSTGDSTGQHLHFEIHNGRWNSARSNAVNPLLFID